MFSNRSNCFRSILLLASIIPLDAVKVPIVVDGLFEDWSNIDSIAIDPVGDVSSGEVDFSKIWVTDDGT